MINLIELKEASSMVTLAMKNFNDDDAEIIRLNDKIQGILKRKNLTWEQKFNIIFSEGISKRVFEIINLDYYNPDTSYEEDVKAFVEALDKWVNTNIQS